MIRRTAAGMAILGFALACLLGALTGSSLERALAQALLAMAGFFLVGLGVGSGFQALFREHFRSLAGRDGDDVPAPGKPDGAKPPPQRQE